MVKLLKQSSISLHFEKHKGSTGGLQGTTNMNPVNATFETKYQPDQNEDNIFLKPKDDRTTYGERVDDRLEAGWGLKRFGKTQSRWVEQQFTTGAISQGKRRNANRGVEEAYEG